VFLIFGIKRMAKRLATVFALCGHCATPAAQVVGSRSTWFSLFFIPVIPLGSKYFSTCTLCGTTTSLDKAQAMLLAASADQGSAQQGSAQPGSLPPPPTGLPAPAPPTAGTPHLLP
jgi:hypothetical protein